MISVKRFTSRISPFAKWILGIAIGMLIIVFNDEVGDNEFFAIFCLIYFGTLFFLLIRWFFRQIRSTIRLKNEKSKTEMLHLKSQVNPHFFFNILNNLYGWVEKDPKKAKDMILKLSDMMRYSIYDGQKDQVSLEEEVDYLKNYIKLHNMRYLKETHITFDIQLSEDGIKVMPLLFIILLENAFKHGVENLIEHAYVHIRLHTTKDDIHFSIENNFDQTETSKKGGIGLKNLKRRLELAYPRQHKLSFSVDKEVYKAELSVKKL